MLNVLPPTSNHPLAAAPALARQLSPRFRGGSHPPLADGSCRRDAPLSGYRAESASRMAYEAGPWVGMPISNGHGTMQLAPPASGMIANASTHVTAKSVFLNAAPVPAAVPGVSTVSSAAPPARYQPSSPVHAPQFEALGNEDSNDESSNQIVSYLQIPSSINDSKGSLSDFAAQITCLFWFESSFNLHRVEDAPSTPSPLTPLVEDAKPCMGFRKWVTTMLSTTQVTQNVILLALLFIYRLKKQNPQVKGKPGSEYRLLTVALMLGNKFLDDNTYTNKTWADVSGIAVKEIHVMEVEFLSNMRYNLYTSAAEWQQWHRKLGRFWDYFEQASKPVADLRSRPTTSLPSPPQSQHASPSFRGFETAVGMPSAPPAYLPPNLPGAMPRMSEIDLRPTSRKRSYDAAIEEPPAKRIPRPMATPSRPNRPRGLSDGPVPSFAADMTMPRLPVPTYPSTTYAQTPTYPADPMAQVPANSARAMAMVYGNVQQPQAAFTSPAPYLEASNLARLQIPPVPGSMPSRPASVIPATSATVSPTSLAATPNPGLLSPAGYTIHRSSPYRPVRSVNTLLVPPPSTSLQNPPLHLGAANMHYQPLGRPPSERRTGVVPFVHHDPAQWPQYSPYR